MKSAYPFVLACIFSCMSTVVAPAAAVAQTGVSDDRVNLPEGPGSLDGIGDNAGIDPNMGLFRYSFPLALPTAWNGATPGLSLSYSSSAGSGLLGIGWNLDVQSIERASMYGLPEYTAEDNFVVNGSDLLVRVASGDPTVYRARREGGFARYLWHENDAGTGGYWEVQNPDGTRAYFGADAAGNEVETARLTGANGVFRYLLVETRDTADHSVRYDYQTLGTTLLPSAIRWGFVDGSPLYEARFSYELRPDTLSDCRPGFNERTEHRLTAVSVRAEGEEIRRYEVAFEDVSASGGFSRVQRIVQYGRDGGEYPIDVSLSYSQGLGATCESEECAQPYLVTMPSLGVDISGGAVTLADLNGDALPDFVDTSGAGAHRIFFNRLVPQADGSFVNTFDAPVDSEVATGGGFGVASPYVQMLDVNGDGFADMLHAQRAEVLLNEATGDWAEIQSLSPTATEGLPDFADGFEFGDDELPNIRFLDYDNDRRIDVLRSEGNTITEVYANNGAGGFEQVDNVGLIGVGFEQGLQLADMNGDGLLDPVQVLNGQVSWKLNLGRGRWTTNFINGTGAPTLTESDLDLIELEDLNGDALDDLVLISGNVVRYWLNRGGNGFDAEGRLTSAEIDGIPERTSSTAVLFADMNGNGSSDIVWATSSGAVTYLELFPQRPNLLTRLETGIGLVTEVTYGTSVEHMSRDGGAEAWPNRLPFAMNVVDSINTYDLLNNVPDVTAYTYHDGFYDGNERQFRGYAEVEITTEGDEFEEGSYTLRRYDVGDSDSYRAGLALEVALFAVNGDEREPLLETRNEYEDCALSGLPASGLRFPIRFVCNTATEEISQERAPEAEWVRTRSEREYDGYGNVLVSSQLGIVGIGSGGCGPCSREDGEFGDPCGADCSGDEMFVSASYIVPDSASDPWILNMPSSQRFSATQSGDEYAETRTYYDGDDFVGLPSGQLTHGRIKRVEERVSTDDEFVATERYAHDEHGNVIEAWGARASASNRIERRTYTFDDGLFFSSSNVLLTDSEGLPITLRAEVEHDRSFQQPVAMTGWYIVEETADPTARTTRYTYDEFGRTLATFKPGDPEGAPSTEFEHDLQSPVSRIVSRSRSQVGMTTPDIVNVSCLDGFGRAFQFRDRVGDTSWHVSSHRRLGSNGDEIELYQPWRGTSEACETTPGSDMPPTTMRYDALGRYLGMVEPVSADGFQEIRYSVERYPRSDAAFDPEDLDPESAHFNTPTIRYYDGLDRTVAVERVGSGGSVLRHGYTYNAYGNPVRSIDPEGVELSQVSTPDGRVVELRDPHRGQRTFEHDLSGNIVAETDARGVVVRSAFDGANRRIAEWDDADREGTLTQWFYDRAPGCGATECTNATGLLAGSRFVINGEVVNEFYGYDLRQQPVLVRRDLRGIRYEFNSEYDNFGRLVREEMPGGIELDYERDGIGRITRVPSMVEAIGWEERGMAERIELANGVEANYLHDDEMRLIDITSVDTTGAAVLAYTFERDRVGNVLRVTDGRAAEGIPSGNVEYEYDALYRLTRASYDEGREGFAEEITWDWSDAGNLAARSSSLGSASSQHVVGISYGGGGAGPYALTALNSATYEYDPTGNTTRRGDIDLEWDAIGRLSAARRGATEVLGEYAYDAFDQRSYKREGSSETFYFGERFEIRDGIATVYLDIDQLRLSRLEVASLAADVVGDNAPLAGSAAAGTIEADGIVSAADAWVSNAVSTGAITLASGTVGDARAQLASSAHRLLLGDDLEARSFYHQNHTGNIAAITNEDGDVIERNEYYAEGQIRWASAGGVESHGYSGKEHDASGLLYFGARYLDPVTGRWVSPDPTFIHVDGVFVTSGEEATNPYSYGLGNPVNSRDPDGRFVDNVVGAALGFVGGALITGITEYIQQRNEIKSGSRTRINWKQLAFKAGVSAAIGGAVGATGLGGLAAVGVGLAVKAGSSAVTTTMKWRAERNLADSRATGDLGERKRLEKRARWWNRAALGTDVAVAVVGLGMGVADVVGATAASHIFGDALVPVASGLVATDAAASAAFSVVDAVSGHKADRQRRAARHGAQASASAPAAATTAAPADTASPTASSTATSGTARRPRSNANAAQRRPQLARSQRLRPPSTVRTRPRSNTR